MLQILRISTLCLPILAIYACTGAAPTDILVSDDASLDASTDSAQEDVLPASGEKLCNGADVGTSNPDYGCAAKACAPCVRIRSTAKCAQGACAIDTCDTGYGSCDGRVENGCETNLSENVEHCGACGVKCVGGDVCNQGKCAKTCDNGLTNCGGACINLQASDVHCGKCGNSCTTQANAKPGVCSAGLCKVECNPGFLLCGGTNTCEGTKPAVIEFVVDGSGSMTEANKWETARASVMNIVSSLRAAGRTDLYVGLMVFSDGKDCTNGSGPYPTSAGGGGCLPDVPVALLDVAQEQKMTARLNTNVGGPSPVFAALKGGHAAIAAFATAPVGATKSVIILTDGSPTDANAPTILQNITMQTSVFTHVIGMQASGYEPSFLSELAIAGRTRKSATCKSTGPTYADYCHTTVESGKPTFSTDTVAALYSAYERATSCN